MQSFKQTKPIDFVFSPKIKKSTQHTHTHIVDSLKANQVIHLDINRALFNVSFESVYAMCKAKMQFCSRQNDQHKKNETSYVVSKAWPIVKATTLLKAINTLMFTHW